MASNKECLIIVLDVRNCAAEEFKLKSVKCAAEILKDKIVGDKKDYVSFVLVGCENSRNELHEKDGKACRNVVQDLDPRQCSWQMLLKFFNFVNETASDEGEWLDGIEVAMAMQKTAEPFRCPRKRILLLFDFNHMAQRYDDYERITNSLLEQKIELIVGTHNIAYINNTVNDQPQAIFNASRKATPFELENQKHARRLVSDCNATLGNLKETLASVFKVSNRCPWVWSAKLYLGTVISINLQGIIAMKNESHIKLKKVWNEANETMVREERFFIKGTEVKPLPEDLIDGYMLGGTPVPYDETLVEPATQHRPGLHFLGFVKRINIPDAYYCGDSLYMLAHQKHNTASAQKLDALVKALILRKSVVLCWKIFSAKFNTPKIVVLIPQEATENRPAVLYMVELSYHGQELFWDFPALRTEKTECSPDQLQAVDKLIDSMDLELTPKDTQTPRQQRQSDLLPFDSLPSIYEQNVMDVLERRVIKRMSKESEDAQLKQMLNEKKFVEVFWRVPEPNEQKSKQAAAEIKNIFPLEHSQAWMDKLKAKENEHNAPPAIQQEQTDPEPNIRIENLGLITPDQDYIQLMRQVRSISNTTQRDTHFQSLAAQMRVVILTLLERNKLNLEQLREVLTLHRESCLEFNSFAEYNKFAAEIKIRAAERNLQEFWKCVMVELQLGPLVLGEPTLDDELRLKAYYTQPEWQQNEDNALQMDI